MNPHQAQPDAEGRGSPLAQPQDRMKNHLTEYPEGRTQPIHGRNRAHDSKRKHSFHTEPGDCGWWHDLVKEQGVASRGGRSREQHYPKSILNNRCFQLQNSAGYSLATTTSVHSKALTCNTKSYQHFFLVLHFKVILLNCKGHIPPFHNINSLQMDRRE